MAREDEAVDYDTITYEQRGAVGLITLNRPDRLNAWTPRMASEQADAIRAANQDNGVGAIVMTGAGRGFCAGADMRDTFGKRLDGTDPAGDGGESGGMPPDVDWVGLIRESKPLIAAVNGAAVGIGTTMILPFDVIVASERAKFGMLFIKVGLVPELASTRLLASALGWVGPARCACPGTSTTAPRRTGWGWPTAWRSRISSWTTRWGWPSGSRPTRRRSYE